MTKRKLRLEEDPGSVDAYIGSCPKAVQGHPREIRAAIRQCPLVF
jgi:hypothetical protein